MSSRWSIAVAEGRNRLEGGRPDCVRVMAPSGEATASQAPGPGKSLEGPGSAPGTPRTHFLSWRLPSPAKGRGREKTRNPSTKGAGEPLFPSFRAQTSAGACISKSGGSLPSENSSVEHESRTGRRGVPSSL